MVKNCSNHRHFRVVCTPIRPVFGPVGAFWAHLPCHRRQRAACHPDIGQRKQHFQMRSVLGQSTESDFTKPELAFDDTKRMLNLGAQAGFGPLNVLRQPINGTVAQGTPPERVNLI